MRKVKGERYNYKGAAILNIPQTEQDDLWTLTCAAAAVSGQVVPGRTDAVEAAGCVHALMDAEQSRLTEGKQMALVDIWNRHKLINRSVDWKKIYIQQFWFSSEDIENRFFLTAENDQRFVNVVVIGMDWSPVQMLLSRPDMVKPTSQVQRVEPRKCVQWEGRTEEEGEDDVGDWWESEVAEEDADRAAEAGNDDEEEAEEEGEAGEKEGRELAVLLRSEKKNQV